MKKEKEIKSYFDKGSVTRDMVFKKDPILGYEQTMRQKAVIELLDIKKNDMILDVGCGNARDILLFAREFEHVYGMDFSSGMVMEGMKVIKQNNLQNITVIIGNAISLPFKDGTFDKISCSEVIEHIPNWEDSIKEMCRCLKNNGRLVITTPNKRSFYTITKSARNMILRLQKKGTHPYDDWKNQDELIYTLDKYGIKVDKKIGICYLPGHAARIFPKTIKKLFIKIIYPIEKRIRYSMSGTGYMHGISGIKLK